MSSGSRYVLTASLLKFNNSAATKTFTFFYIMKRVFFIYWGDSWLFSKARKEKK